MPVLLDLKRAAPADNVRRGCGVELLLVSAGCNHQQFDRRVRVLRRPNVEPGGVCQLISASWMPSSSATRLSLTRAFEKSKPLMD
jgi:hypothetical protein